MEKTDKCDAADVLSTKNEGNSELSNETVQINSLNNEGHTGIPAILKLTNHNAERESVAVEKKAKTIIQRLQQSLCLPEELVHNGK